MCSDKREIRSFANIDYLNIQNRKKEVVQKIENSLDTSLRHVNFLN